MKVLAILALLSILGVSSTYGEEKSCDEMLLTTSSNLKNHFEALKVYKKVEDKTEMYLKGKKKIGNDGTVEELKMSLMLAERVRSQYNVPRELVDLEQRDFFALGELLVKDIEDKSSEVVLLCVGRMRTSDGVRHFMLSVTKDEEGDRFWTARLY